MLHYFYLWNTGLKTEIENAPSSPHPRLHLVLNTFLHRFYIVFKLFENDPFLKPFDKTQEFFPQVMKQVVSLSCYYHLNHGHIQESHSNCLLKEVLYEWMIHSTDFHLSRMARILCLFGFERKILKDRGGVSFH